MLQKLAGNFTLWVRQCLLSRTLFHNPALVEKSDNFSFGSFQYYSEDPSMT